MKLNEAVIKIREENNLTQEEMAKRIFVTRQAISKWERGLGYPSLDVLRLISREFKISINELLGVGKSQKNAEYKPIGFKNRGFIALYAAMLAFVIAVTTVFNLLSLGGDADLWELIVSDVFLGFVCLMVVILLIQSIFPVGLVLIEYNDYGVMVKTLRGRTEIPFQKTVSIEIKTHGNWNSGKMIVRTFDANYQVYPLKELNQVKTIIDEVRILNRY